MNEVFTFVANTLKAVFDLKLFKGQFSDLEDLFIWIKVFENL